jgi:hypothetical protein
LAIRGLGFIIFIAKFSGSRLRIPPSPPNNFLSFLEILPIG